MGTVQKIVESLIRISEEKKCLLNNRFQDHSSWMGNELALIRDLIRNTKSRDSNISTVANNSNDICNSNEENISPQNQNSFPSSSEEIRKFDEKSSQSKEIEILQHSRVSDDGDKKNHRSKRKSPEISAGVVRSFYSPDVKRTAASNSPNPSNITDKDR